MPNLPDQAGHQLQLRRDFPGRQLLEQPAGLPFDYQPFQSLRTTFKYSGERQRRQTFPGTLAGYNDTQTHDPVVTTTALTVNYSLNSTTFIEANYGYARNAVARLRGHLHELHRLDPDEPGRRQAEHGTRRPADALSRWRRHGPALLQYEQLTKMNTPMFQNGTILLPPTFNWGNRVATARPTCRIRAGSTTT